MAVVINGSGTVTGLAVGGLPDGTVDAGTLATDSVTAAKLKDDAIAVGDLPAGSVLQVVQEMKTDTSSTTATSSGSATSTGIAASITPSSTSSKILIMVSLMVSHSAAYKRNHFTIVGGNAANYIGDPATGHESSMSVTQTAHAGYGLINVNMIYLDSPSTTSSTTYTVYHWTESGTSYINRAATMDANGGNTASTITLMEIAG